MKGNMQRVLATEVTMMYPKQWILLVNSRKEPERHCPSGEIYLISDSRDEIHTERCKIGNTLGDTLVVEGFDDTPRIGGLLR